MGFFTSTSYHVKCDGCKTKWLGSFGETIEEARAVVDSSVNMFRIGDCVLCVYCRNRMKEEDQ